MTEYEIAPSAPDWVRRHIELYLSDPEAAHYWDASVGGGTGLVPTLLLMQTGRKSGKVRPLPLIYGEADGAFVIIASKGGSPEHPAWYRNLQAQPDVEIRCGPHVHRVRARTAQGAERDRLWDAMVEIYAPYAEYQQRAGDREIPVVVLEERQG